MIPGGTGQISSLQTGFGVNLGAQRSGHEGNHPHPSTACVKAGQIAKYCFRKCAILSCNTYMFKDLHSAPSEVQFIVSANTSGVMEVAEKCGVVEEARNVSQQNATPEHIAEPR